MLPIYKKLLWMQLFLLIFLSSRVVLADTGPKPSMEFKFKQEQAGEPLTIVSGIMYECEQSDCSDAAPLEEVGPQGFSCTETDCSAQAYGFAPYHRIEIEFSDGNLRRSNVFTATGFDSHYTVTIRPAELLVESQFALSLPPLTTAVVLLCACLLCGIVLLTVLVVFLIRRSSRK